LLAAYIVGCGDGDSDNKAENGSPTSGESGTETPKATPTDPPPELQWRKLDVLGGPPRGRVDHSVVTDGNKIWMFGGRSNEEPLGDNWLLEPQALSWQEVALAGPPPPRFGHNAVYDNRLGGMMLFGGQAAGAFFNDAWLLGVEPQAWRQLDVGDARPAERYGAASALTGEARLLVSHGFTSTGRFNDTWSLGGTPIAWEEATVLGTKPVERCLMRGVWDVLRSRFLMFGGQTTDEPFLGDLWAFNASGWAEIETDEKPSPRNFYSMVYDDRRERAILFGGNTENGAVDDVWFFDAINNSWTQPEIEGEKPSARYGHDAVWIGNSSTMVVVGGHDASGDLIDVWELTVPG
jgi:hypothetical protein